MPPHMYRNTWDVLSELTDDPDLIAMDAYATWERRGVKLAPASTDPCRARFPAFGRESGYSQ